MLAQARQGPTHHGLPGRRADLGSESPFARSRAVALQDGLRPADHAVPDITPKPALVTKWGYVDDKGLALGLDLRSDVVFHDGSKMTAEDFKFSFFDRPRLPVAEGGRKLDTAFIWRRVKDIEIVSPTRVVMHFTGQCLRPWRGCTS